MQLEQLCFLKDTGEVDIKSARELLIKCFGSADGVRTVPQLVEHALTRSVRGSGTLVAAHSRTNSTASDRVQSTIDKLQSHMGVLRITHPAMPPTEDSKLKDYSTVPFNPSIVCHPRSRVA